MSETKKLIIVAGVAWDSTADPVWENAETLLRSRPDASLHLCHVVGRGALRAESAESSAIDSALARLHAWVVEKAGRDNPICAQIHLEVAIGDPAEEIVQLAVDNDADLLLLGTHARKGVAKLVLGSIAEQALHHAPCAVLIARATDFDGRTKSPSIAPPPEPGHKPFHPHAQRYHSSVVFSTFDASLNPTGA